MVGRCERWAAPANARPPPPACRHNMQSETEALGRIDHNSRAVGGNGRAKHERHGARSRHTQAGGNGKAAALGVSLSDVAAGKIRKREQKRVKGLRAIARALGKEEGTSAAIVCLAAAEELGHCGLRTD